MKLHTMLFALASITACQQPIDLDTGTEPAPEAGPSQAVRIEQLARELDRGGDAAAIRAELETILIDPSLSLAEKADAAVALSRAWERLGEHEKAIALIEKEIAANAGNRDWPGRNPARRLRELLTGSETAPGLQVKPEPKNVPPFAHVLAEYFPRAADGGVHAKFFMSGGDDEASKQIGTWDVRGAIQAQQNEKCPLCDEEVNVSRSTRQSDFTVIPEKQAEFGEAVTVFYFDLGKNRIPARYESHLPMKVAAIVAELEAGKSFALAKEKDGAPPAILIAAPRTMMLREVEEALAQLSALPLTPHYVEVGAKLRPEEIQATVRGEWFDSVRGCYEDLQKRTPQAQGRFEAKFTIGVDGSVSDGRIEADGSLDEAAFVSCLGDSLAKVRFPKTGHTVTVGYPVVVTP